ncbi:NADPH-dependent 7-cyano-7-deazaguanine reductase QueF [Xylella taiwanensis]|uniref:NADPH-dependent 7-cyano-7-deazaguanine reductase n=1 Tax=Xylella taiwanensis TaxID=1444770 RepID=Z9JM11_9GAMM|nr:NADPH-dependent 7-cyano-7-deazaguanine reductase QueF [Xylella taiwanensis]EWS79199.1 7-cyano-7-deazaguanine reductase [Xylella taiwanensis]MCD8456334.1 NADPH-dependent 7-cyano-7-deazaguanine reductase QueF [Xylella taiwanensis]MCD8458743.1 NADPH-dependent 7-cyano-7-deazaguanine reductase QueF [Xylella taiwanensis]MCD8460877.1 NADPH-dependent 7-cyano-7-deazaguanine reductase QueF [Xylella taiwanensis]MCD8463063.1 NADPH-dependent 7-cyano-7-deazaguanine reductase QueF [Xylella taiwanensis]
MNTPQYSALGHVVPYPRAYDPSLLFPISRAVARTHIGIGVVLPFVGEDRWHAYELSWLDARGKPCVATATLHVPCDSPCLIESKSLKLYLNSFNAETFDSAEVLRMRIATDVSVCAGAAVTVEFGLPPAVMCHTAMSLDGLNVAMDDYGPPNPDYLSMAAQDFVEETLTSALFKSNCPVTGQPDWASVTVRYFGAPLDHEGLLRYLVSFRNHAAFHEQCVERIFQDVLQRCAPQWLAVEARYTRRGGLDINPLRATPDMASPIPVFRDPRQ